MSRPNVLFIPLDDLRPELGCYGADWIKSPHMDALAASGTRFNQAHCQQAICGPSRASLLTGMRPDECGIHELRQRLDEENPDLTTIPRHFKAHGYKTMSFGKVFHHKTEEPHAWSQPPFIAQGDWQGRGYLTDEAIEAVQATNEVLAARGDHRRGLGPAWECADVDDEAYHDGIDATQAIKALHELAESEEPFFLACGFHKPHLPFNSPKKYWDLYDRADIPLAINPFRPEKHL